MATPSEVVANAFANAENYATEAKTALTSFTTALSDAIYAPPSISVTWNSLAKPSIEALPSTPSLPTISFTDPTAPTALSLTDPSINIDSFAEIAPTVTIGAAPTITYGAVPTVSSPTMPTLPSAPTISLPLAPTLLSLSTPTFAGVDLHTAFLTNLENIPTLTLASPTPYSYSPGPEYASTLLDALKAVTQARLAGGTGLAPAVEQAIWDRARNREIATAQANIDEINRASEALGFLLPTGALASQMRAAQQDYYDKLSGLSRDVAIKQAELEQENLKQAIASGMDLEGKLIDYSYKLEALSFESAKELAANTIQVYNAQVEKFKALLQGYQTYATVYKTLIDGEMFKVEVYKAELQAEQTKANVNSTLVEQYKATIEAELAHIKIFEAQISAANALVQIEQAKLGATSEQIRAFTASVNAETAKIEAYKASIQGEGMKVELYKTKAQAFSAVVGAQAEKARVELGVYSAKISAKGLEWDGYRARVGAETARIQALSAQSGMLLDGYRIAATAIQAKSNMYTQVWETEIKNYEAGQQIALQAGKINNDSLLTTNNARLDAAKAGAQVYAQLTSSAYSMIHASAGVSASSGMNVGYSYSNDTSGTAPTITSV